MAAALSPRETGRGLQHVSVSDLIGPRRPGFEGPIYLKISTHPPCHSHVMQNIFMHFLALLGLRKRVEGYYTGLGPVSYDLLGENVLGRDVIPCHICTLHWAHMMLMKLLEQRNTAITAEKTSAHQEDNGRKLLLLTSDGFVSKRCADKRTLRFLWELSFSKKTSGSLK